VHLTGYQIIYLNISFSDTGNSGIANIVYFAGTGNPGDTAFRSCANALEDFVHVELPDAWLKVIVRGRRSGMPDCSAFLPEVKNL